MIKLLKKIVVQLGGVDVSEKNYITTFSEELIKNVSGEKIAASQNGGIWVGFSELNEYNFMEINIIGLQEYKTYKGAELVFLKNGEKITHLMSDCQEIVSTFSNVSNRYLTSISFDVSNLDLTFLSDKKAEIVVFKCSKKEEEFNII